MQERITRIEVTLFGPTGNNGVVGTQKALVADVKELLRLLALFTTVLRTLKWVALAAGVIGATFKPETLADLIKIMAAIAKLSG